MGDEDFSDICQPIKDKSLLLNWKCDGKCWIHKHNVVDLSHRTGHVSAGYVLDSRGKSDVFSEYRLSSDLLPKTIFCHDYKGGYVEDRFCNGSPNINTYRFFNWAGIDIFIYFSHHLVTIPTQGWLNAGHTHGVPVLGTFITEWKDGEEVWRDILTDIVKTNLYTEKLAQICAHFKFDGYLLNVENKIPKDFVPRLVQFVALLKAQLDLHCGRQTWLIWYDSVTTEGDLKWQNKLCPLNKPFFDACDGIFLNYVWKPSDLLESIDTAGPRRHDVFVGLDVWGRNCYQDGGFNVDKAMAVIRSLNMSVALFAPGWTFETLPTDEEFLPREITFWRKVWPYLYIHGPASLPFYTNFNQGVSFNKLIGTPCFNLGMQQHQPTTQGCFVDPQNSCVSLYLKDGLLYNGACLKVTAASPEHSKIFHRILACDFAGDPDKTTFLEVTLALKNMDLDCSSKFKIYFVFEDRISIEGKERADMKRRPKGYRATTAVPGLVVSGSVMDFTAECQIGETKIKVLNDNVGDEPGQNPWREFKFLLELNAGASLTELLLLPAPTGSVLWGLLKVKKIHIHTC